ncbi:hypothetical protein T11_6983 [Trichinella zimbabwensis]|uniref:Uncharacterized protein n=1 Tax=Trichinella zimbabwensis TaxID=268475 RepID=A0A0V1H4N9_9BILA|nr:hypothetical protein T11_6983 [Trichinella zimbabwensis]
MLYKWSRDFRKPAYKAGKRAKRERTNGILLYFFCLPVCFNLYALPSYTRDIQPRRFGARSSQTKKYVLVRNFVSSMYIIQPIQSGNAAAGDLRRKNSVYDKNQGESKGKAGSFRSLFLSQSRLEVHGAQKN